jgi:hypothetical protein
MESMNLSPNHFWTVAQDGGLAGGYKGWSFDRANNFISDLVRVIQRHKCHIFGAVVNLSDFYSFDEESRRFLTGATFHIQRQRFVSSGKPNSAYFMVLTAVIAKAVERAAMDRELCHFIFGEQEEYASLAKTRVAEFRQHLRRSGLADSLGDSVIHPPTGFAHYRPPTLWRTFVNTFTGNRSLDSSHGKA